MKILHHVDDDGFCSAAIVNWLIKPYGIVLNDDDCILYNYNGSISIPEFHKDEYVYIVDISLDNEVFKFIKEAVRNKCRVVHIDHHKTTLEWLKNAKATQKRVLDKVTKFYNTRVSASMLCWIYASAYQYLNENNNINFCIDQDTFYVNDEPETVDESRKIKVPVPHKIPPIVMYVDDYDTSSPYTHKFGDETQYFHYGFELETDKRPNNIIWQEMLFDYTGVFHVDDYVANGKIIGMYKDASNTIIGKSNAFESTVFGIPCICINTCGNSSAVGNELFNQYPITIVYHFAKGKWKYSIYNNPDVKRVDVSVIAKFCGGGGHAAAAGFTSKLNYFDTTSKSNKIKEFHERDYLTLPR